MKFTMDPVARIVASGGRILILLLFCILSSATAPATTYAQILSVTRRFVAPQIRTGVEYSRVTVVDCDTLQRVGAPLLPFRTVRLLLPPGARVGKIETQLPQSITTVPGIWKVDYGRMPVSTVGSNVKKLTIATTEGPDPTIYESDQLYPPVRAELASIQQMAGYTIAFIRLYPIQYAPTKGELIFAPELTVELTMDPNAAAVMTMPASICVQEREKGRVANFVDNPEMLKVYESVPRPSSLSGLTSYDYLLITRSNLVTAFQPLVDLKTQAGLAVKVETMEAITNTFSGQDMPEKLRNYIRAAYTNWNIAYVLLGGDIPTVPYRIAYIGMGGVVDSPFLPTDLYFACLDGSWNNDNDARWGEPTDGEGGVDVDLLAEVYVGRAPVDTVAEVNIFVEKTVRYETQSHPNVTNVLLMAEFLADTSTGPAQGGDMFVPLEPLFGAYQLTWLDDRPWTEPQWNKADGMNALNRSPHSALLNGHGDDLTLIGQAYPFLRAIETQDLDNLTNQWLFLAYSVGCNVGQFDNFEPFQDEESFPDSIGEQLVKRHHRGAFAAVFNSREGLYDNQDEAKYSGEFQLKFFTNLLSQGHTNLGVANQLGKHDLLAHVESMGIMSYRWCYYEITFFGDPHAAWKTPPSAPPSHRLVVVSTHEGASPPAGTNIFSHGSLIVGQVTNSPLAGAIGWQSVCTGWFGSGSVPASGSGTQVTFTITNDSLLTWQWTTQVRLQVEAGRNGAVTAANGWYDVGASGVAVVAEPSLYYHFVRWFGDAPAGTESNLSLQLTMDGPRNLTAEFTANLTSRGTPAWWLADFGWTNEFEAVCELDTDSDGMAAWQEYIAGTCPTNLASVLRINLTRSGNRYVVEWPSVSNRFYSVQRAASLVTSFDPVTNDLPANPPRNTFTDNDTNASAGFYQVTVRNAQ